MRSAIFNKNNTELEKPPNIDALRFNFNSSTNKYLAYEFILYLFVKFNLNNLK